MSIFKLGRTAAWMSVAIMASLSTLFVLAAALLLAWTETLDRLDPPVIATLLLTGAVVALAPWWSLVTMLVARRRA